MSFGLGRLGAGFGRMGLLGAAPPRQQLINSLKGAGVWSLLDSLYLFAQPTSALASVDLINPARSITVSGSPTFTANRGYTGDGVSAFLDTNYNPATNAVNLTQNSNSFGFWSLTSAADAAGGYDFGQSNYAIASFAGSNASYGARNAAPNFDSLGFGTNPGLIASSRSLSTGFNLYKDSAKLFSAGRASQSPNIFSTHTQGWTTDGTVYYTFETAAIRKRSKADWSILASNTTPFAGLSGSPNHCGDGCYANGKLYVPVENWSGTCGGANSAFQIVVFDASTLAFIETHAVTVTELSGIGVDATNGILYGSSFCNPNVIYRFDLTTFAALSSIVLNGDYTSIQGVTYKSGSLYLSCNSSTAAYIAQIDLTGNPIQAINTNDIIGSFAIEGLDFDGASLGVVADDSISQAFVNFYTTPATGNTLTRTSTAINSETFTAFKRNSGSVFTTNQLAAAFVGGALSDAQFAAFYTALKTYLRRLGAAT